MIRSMTGYGSAKGFAENLEIIIELRSVNSRYLDCSVKLPRIYLFAENELKSAVKRLVGRGKVDVLVNIDSAKAGNVAISVDEPLVAAYLEAFDTISKTFNIKNDVSAFALTRVPDVLNVEKKTGNQDLVVECMLRIIEEAAVSLNNMRKAEGEKMYADISARLDIIRGIIARIEERSPKTVTEYRDKLKARLRDMLSDTNIEESRLLTEAAIFADRINIDEEITRLKSHVSQSQSMMDSDEAVGRKLDFITQELLREANTIGSKCNDAEISKLVIDLKAEIEKIREQVQNIV